MNKIGIALLLGAVFAVGCGEAGGTGGSSTSKASGTAKTTASGGTTAAAGGGSTDDYVKAYCDCKNESKCLTDTGIKYAETLSKNPLNADQTKKIGDCTMAAAGVPSGMPSMPSGMPSAK